MDVSEQTVLHLVAGQAKIEQSLTDLKDRINRDVPVLVASSAIIADRFKMIEDNIDEVEHKLWYFGGAGSVIGALFSVIVEYYFKLKRAL